MTENMASAAIRKSYEGVVACVPVTVPYRRYSINSAHWWIGRALHELVNRAGIRSTDIDGFGVSSFTVAPDTAVGLTQHFGLTPRQYSLAFAVNAAAFIGAAQCTAALTLRFGQLAVIRLANTGFALTMLLLLLLHLAGVDRLDVMIVLLLLGFGCYGLASPAVSVLALDPHGPIAGTASALMGTLQFVTGAVVMAVIGFFVDGGARPMLLGIAGCASLALLLTLLTLGARTSPRHRA